MPAKLPLQTFFTQGKKTKQLVYDHWKGREMAVVAVHKSDMSKWREHFGSFWVIFGSCFEQPGLDDQQNKHFAKKKNCSRWKDSFWMNFNKFVLHFSRTEKKKERRDYLWRYKLNQVQACLMIQSRIPWTSAVIGQFYKIKMAASHESLSRTHRLLLWAGLAVQRSNPKGFVRSVDWTYLILCNILDPLGVFFAVSFTIRCKDWC